MGPARHHAPGRIPAQLAPLLLLLLLLLLRLPSVRGDCSLPPDVPNAQPDLRGLSSFPQDTTITYKCSEGFVKVPSLPDSIVCLESEWSEIAEFCNRSCAVPPRLLFAALKKIYSKQNYFPAGSTVEYECRMGYKRDPGLSGQLTCLQDFAWSKPVEFCKKKSCPNPGEIKNGHINITTDILFGASIFFSCNTGYKLEGETSSYCSLADNTVRWSHPLPECKEIHCPDPPEIANGTIQEPQTTYVYQQSVTYRCAKGFRLVGGSSIYCTMKGDQPAWSSPVPACKESSQISKVTPAVQKPTTVTAPGTKPKPIPHKPTPASAPGTKPKPTHQKPTSANAPGTKPKPTHQKPTTINSSATKTPLTSHKPTTASVPGTEASSAPQKPTTISALPTKPKPTPQKPTTASDSATKAPLTPHKPTTASDSATKAPLTPQKPTTISALPTKPKPTPQKPTTGSDSATKAPLTPQKPTTISVLPTKPKPTPQKPTTTSDSATKDPLTPQRPTTVNSSATKSLLTPQRPNTAIDSATKFPLAPQKPTTINSSATKILLTSQKPTTANVPTLEAPSAPQKPTTANNSATTIQKSPLSNTLSAKTPAALNPSMAHASATQATRPAQRLTTAKAVLTQSPPATHKATAGFSPVTKGAPTTQRLTSAHVTVKQSPAAPKATTRVHTTSTAKGQGPPPSGANNIAVGFVAGTVLIVTVILIKIVWDYGKSGSYDTGEDSKGLSVTFRN